MDNVKQRRVLFDDMPETLAILLDEVKLIKEGIREIQEANSQTRKQNHVPIGIERVSELTGKAVTTLYRYTAHGLIPCYKKGKSMLFYEDEIMEWIQSGKCESIEEKAEKIGSTLVPLTHGTY